MPTFFAAHAPAIQWNLSIAVRLESSITFLGHHRQVAAFNRSFCTGLVQMGPRTSMTIIIESRLP